MVLKSLLLFAIVFCFCHGGHSHQACNTSSLAKIAVGNETSCNFKADSLNYSINDLDKVLKSCTEVSFCSTSLLKVQRTLSFRDLYGITFSGLSDTAIDCGNTASVQFMNVTNLTVMNLQFVNCAERFNLSISYKGNHSHPYWIGIMIFNCKNILFENVTIGPSTGIGMAVFNTAGTNTFHKCLFELNGKDSGAGLVLEIKLQRCISGLKGEYLYYRKL